MQDQGGKRGRGTKKQPVFGTLCRKGLVWTEMVDNGEAETLEPLIFSKVKKGSIVRSDMGKAHPGIVSR